MKKILITLALAALCGGLSLQASPVSPERALDVARKVLSAQKATRAASGDVKIIWDGEYATKADVQPAIYVVARDGGGWVMVAGDDNVRPVLGLSYDGTFKTEGMPDNVKWWMDWTKAYVRSVTVRTPEAEAQWARLIDTKAGDISDNNVTGIFERLTPEWDQGNNDSNYFENAAPVFNRFCPTKGSSLTVTGCVATALAEIMTYQSGLSGETVPSSGTGTVGGYTVDDGGAVPSAYSLGYVYDWDGLRGLATISDIQSSIDNSDLIENLGHLMADLGAAMHASYNTVDVGGTGASTEMIPYYMGEHFGFNKAAHFVDAADYSISNWTTKLKEEIDERPLIFSGRTGNAGHAFILDGYGTYANTTVFHVNFGWGGSNNGYYYVNEFREYQYYCGAVFDFYYAPSSTYPVELEAYYVDSGLPGIVLVEDNNNPSLFNYYLSFGVKNIGNSAYSGKLKFMVRGKNGTERVVQRLKGTYSNGQGLYDNCQVDFALPAGYYSTGTNLCVKIDNIAFGDQVVCYYTDGAEDVLLECIPGNAISEWPLVPVAFIDTADSYSVGDSFSFRIKNYDQLYKGTEWTVTDPDGVSTTYEQGDRNTVLNKAGKYKIQAAIAEVVDGAVVETLETYITVAGN